MELRHLRYFVAVAEHLHFGRAAKELHVSQPPLSQQIRRLEDDLGVRLFDRNRRRVSLTPAGQQFLVHAQAVVEGANRAREAARAAARRTGCDLSVGYSPMADLTVLPAAVRSFGAAFPEVRLSLRAMSSQAQAQALASRLLHIGIIRLPCEQAGLRVEAVLREPLIAVLPRGHRLARHKKISLAWLAEETFILFPRRSQPQHYDSIASLCHREGRFLLAEVQEAETIQTALALVATGLGVSLQPESVKKLPRTDLVYRPLLEPSLMVETGLAYLPGECSAAGAAFLDVVRRCATVPGS